MQMIRVNLGPRSYDIAVTAGDAPALLPFIRTHHAQLTSACVVSDENTLPVALGIADQFEKTSASGYVRQLCPPARGTGAGNGCPPLR